MRTEFAKDHEDPNRIVYFENDGLVRVEFTKDHKEHGRIQYYENDMLVRVEFTKDHKDHCATTSTLSTMKRKRNALYEDMSSIVEEQATKDTDYYTNAVMAKEFPSIDLCNPDQLNLMAKRSKQVRSSYRPPISVAFDNVKKAMEDFEKIARKSDEGYRSDWYVNFTNFSKDTEW